MNARSIDFYYDIISPFAHIALARLAELPPDVMVKPKPVLLGALLNHWGPLGPAEIEPKRLHTYRLAAFLGQRHGLAMRFPPRHPFNSLGALRILAGVDAGIATVRRAFDFVFHDGCASDTDAGLTEFADAVGAPVSLSTNENSKAVLRANTEEAIACGVFGVPTFAVAVQTGHELFWGVDAFDMLLAWLADEKLFTREPYAHLDAVEVGIRRR